MQLITHSDMEDTKRVCVTFGRRAEVQAEISLCQLFLWWRQRLSDDIKTRFSSLSDSKPRGAALTLPEVIWITRSKSIVGGR